MRNPLLVPEIRELLQEGQQQDLRAALAEMHPSDAASILSALEPQELVCALAMLPLEMERDIFGYLEPEVQEQYALGAGKERTKEVLSTMLSDDRAEFLDRLPERLRHQLIPLLSAGVRQDLLRRSQFAPDQVGSFLNSDYAVLSPAMSARAAIDELRRQAPSKETIYYSYVVDHAGRLLGFISLRDLILARDVQPVSELMKKDIVSVKVTTDQEHAAQIIKDYDLIALPVVDDSGHLVGIVTHDDAVDIVEEEAAEDFEKMAGVTGHDEGGFDYAELSLWQQFRRRAPVICVLALFWVITSGVIHGFEETLKENGLLVALLPMVMATGGMIGGQASSLVIRALATGELVNRSPLSILRKELVLAGAMALALAVIAFVDTLTVHILDPKVQHVAHFAAVISIAMICHVLASAILGALTPIVVQKLRGDPAMISTPSVTAMTDLVGATIYLVLVTTLL